MANSLIRRDIFLSFVLIGLMMITRSHHFLTPEFLPDASMAVFFLSGLLIVSFYMIPVLLLAALFIDYSAITWGGVGSFCVTPAYFMLIPAYCLVWFGGHQLSKRSIDPFHKPLLFLALLLILSVCSELLSSGGFYLFSEHYTDLSLVTFAKIFTTYFPYSFMSFFIWIAFIIITLRLCRKVMDNKIIVPINKG